MPAVILVVWRSGHGYVRAGNTGRYFCAFPFISLKIKPVTIDSLRISQKQRESSFISSSLASGHFWMHDKCITAFFAWQRGAPISDRGPIVPSIIQTSNTEVRQRLGKSAILFWFVSLPLTCKPFPISPRWLHTAGSEDSYPPSSYSFSPGSAPPSCSLRLLTSSCCLFSSHQVIQNTSGGAGGC